MEPLAYKMRPKTIDEFVGQEHIVAKNKLLYRMIKADRLTSLIFYGPPGTGKTTLARIIASATSSNFEKINAVSSGIADIKRIVSETQNPLMNPSNRTVLFIDEIHRFNKTQQDALLPYVESGLIILIGATTENPFFEVNKALISRSTVFMLKPLNAENIKTIIKNTLNNKENGLGNLNIKMDEDAIEFLSRVANGDARVALNALEIASMTTDIDENGEIHITTSVIEECVQQKSIKFDKSGEDHYDNISAFIKSMRGSNPDAAVFYLARALYAGEDPLFMARRIMICAAEDVGIANPQALQVAVAAAEAVKMIGMPEGRIILSEAAIYVAVSPKSNAGYMAINNALDYVKNEDAGTIPMHLRNAVTEGMADLGYGNGYKYAHDYPGNFVEQQYLPDELADRTFYEPTTNGFEAKVKPWLDKIRNKDV